MEHHLSINPLLYSQPQDIASLKNMSKQKRVKENDGALKKASQDFEAIVLNFVIKTMWKTIPESSFSGEESGAMDSYTAIMQNALAQDIAAKGGLGMARVLYNQMMNEKGPENNLSPVIEGDTLHGSPLHCQQRKVERYKEDKS
ncbi:MAG: rod-binding protein [Candidatus Brocadiaceae bacterium]|nr:rod-binding protein [Candidatus Brocadiaceae bacterium]